jgi:hypothetical protein
MSTTQPARENVPRDPSHYSPSIHAGQQRKHREIPWDAVAATLREGEVRPSAKPSCRVFVARPTWTEGPVRVIANPECGEIVTIAWERNGDAPRVTPES